MTDLNETGVQLPDRDRLLWIYERQFEERLKRLVDYTKIQSAGRADEVMGLGPLTDKWRAFGWAVREIDGHDVDTIEKTFANPPFSAGRPSCIVAHTVKGKGVSYMENALAWHYRAPRGELLGQALEELERP